MGADGTEALDENCTGGHGETIDVDVAADDVMQDPNARSLLSLSADVVEELEWNLISTSAWKSTEPIHMLDGEIHSQGLDAC